MRILLFIFCLFLAGCCSYPEVKHIKPNFTCQDYANAWAREANKQGLIAGTLWYYPNGNMQGQAHAICWVINTAGDECFIEPQTRKIIELTLAEKLTIFLKNKGPVHYYASPLIYSNSEVNK